MSRPSRFRFETEVPVSAAELWAWHARPGAFERLTPPWEQVQVVARSGPRLENGLRVTLGVGPRPFRLRLTAEHRDCEPGRGFRDVLVSGPFSHWSHRHEMREAGSSASVLEDDLSVALPFHGLVRPLAEPMLGRRLERMFRYRHAVTRGDLEAHARTPGPALRIGVDGAGVLATALRHFLSTGGHAVASPGSGPGSLDASVLVAPNRTDPGPSLGEQLERAHRSDLPGRRIVAGEELPAEAALPARCVALHLGHVLWPGTGWLGWAQPLPGLVRRSSDPRPRRWIALDDALGALLWALRGETPEGPVDAACPEPETDHELARLLRGSGPRLRLPGRPPPPPALPLGLPTLASTGFTYRYARLEQALDHALGRAGGTPPGAPA